MGHLSSGEDRWPKDHPKIAKFRLALVIAILVSIFAGVAVIFLANTRNDELFKLLDTYPGKRGLYFGHDLATGFSAFAIALGIFSLVYYIFYDKFEDEETNRQPVVQVFLIFAFIVQSVLLLSSGLVVLWSANAQNGMDEYKWADDYPLAWKHSSSWDWMTQTFYYEYDNLWRELMKNNDCCGVRGSHEIPAIRALWNNKSDIFSTFNHGLNGDVFGESLCCRDRIVTGVDSESEGEWNYKCVMGEIYHETGCYWKVAWYEFIPLGSILIVMAGLAMFVSVLGSYFHLMQREFPAFFKKSLCCK